MKNRKDARCPVCCPDSPHAIFTGGYDWPDPDGPMVAVWTCTNCGHVIKKRSYKRGTAMTEGQRRTVRWIARQLLVGYGKRYGVDRAKNVFVRNTFKMLDYGVISWGFTVAPKGSKGTMAAIVCRDDYHVQIGRRGGQKLWSKPDWMSSNRI